MSFGIGLTAAMQLALKDGRPLYLFADIDHPNGERFFWTGVGDIEWAGNTYQGVGKLGTLSQVESGSVLQINERTLTLAGVEPTQTEFLLSNVRNRVASFALGCLDKYRKVVPDPYLIDEVLMDAQSLPIDESGRMAIQITGFSGLWSLQRAQNLAWSSEQAKSAYPDETGFDLIPGLVNKDTKWTAA